MDRQQVDISGYFYEQFVTFLFDHAVVVQEGKRRPWYWDVGVGLIFNPVNVCNFYTRLFRQPEFLLDSYSKAQLEQGFWAIQSPNLACSVSCIMWNDELPFPCDLNA